MKNRPIDISVIIVSWNVRDLLARAVQAVLDDGGELAVEIIVVDSFSADGTPAMVRDQFPDVQLIACDTNVGFPRGNNIGLDVAQGDFLFLLNPDTELRPGSLRLLYEYAVANPAVGVIGPELLNPDGSHQSSRRRFPTLATGIFESTWLESIAPRAVLRNYYATDLPDDEINDVDWVSGAALFVRHETNAVVDGMDAGYFMYSEELDYCRRIRDKGWRVVYLPDAKVMHHAGKSSEQAVAARHINFQRAKLRYFRKFHGWLPTAFLRTVLLVNYWAQLKIELTKGLLGHKRKLRWQRSRAYWQVIRSGLPPAGND